MEKILDQTPGVLDDAAQPVRPLVPESDVECWRVERIARFLDVSKKRVYQLVREGRLQAIRLGPRQMRILRRSLESYVDELVASEHQEDLEF